MSTHSKVMECEYTAFVDQKPARPGEYLCTDGKRRVIAFWGTTWEGTPFEGLDWVPESLPGGWMPGQITHWQELGPLHAHGSD